MTENADTRFTLPLEDYERIFRVIYTILSNEKTTNGVCLFFSIAGEEILKKHYSVDAKAVCGSAVIKLTDSFQLTYGKIVEDWFVSDVDAFHSWIEIDGTVIDFMAPLYNEFVKKELKDLSIPVKMFQKYYSDMNTMPGTFVIGDFYFDKDTTLTEKLISPLKNHPIFSLFFKECSDWYERPPTEIKKGFRALNKRGEYEKLKLDNTHIRDAW